MKPKKQKSKSPVDLSENFKLVKTRRNNRTKMKIMAGLLVMFLVTVLISTFFIPKSKTSIDYEEQFPDGMNENIAPQYGQISDVNQIVQEKKRKDNLLNNTPSNPVMPPTQQTVDVTVNMPEPTVRAAKPVREYTYKVDEKKLGEFFSSSKKTPQNETYQTEETQQKNRTVQSFKPKNQPQSTKTTEITPPTETIETTSNLEKTEDTQPEFIL